MQIAARTTLFLIILYLLGLAGAASWLGKDYREASREVMSGTAELIANQLSAALHEATIDEILQRQPDALQQLNQTVATTVEKSDTILSLAVIAATGELLAGGVEGKSYPEAALQFDQPPETRITSEYDSSFSAGRHFAFVPIVQAGKLAAYLRVELSNKRISNLYDRLTSRFANFALVGVTAILALGGLMHLQLSRIGQDIINLMKSTSPPEIKKKRFGTDEFQNLRTEALQLGSENRQNLSTLGTVSQALKVGLVLFGKNHTEVFISDNAREVLGLGRNGTLADGLGEGWQNIKDTIQALADSQTKSTVLDIETEVEDAVKKLEIEFYQTQSDGGHTLALIRNRDHVTALQSSLRAATRMHTLSSIYLGAAHDLRAPISAMVMNLELLEDSLLVDKSSGQQSPDIVNNQQRYIEILKEELNRLQRFLTSFLDNATTVRQSEWQTVELTTIIEELLRLFNVKARQSNVDIQTDFPQASISIIASGDQIRQMFMNILVNALEVMPDGGVLSVSIYTNKDMAITSIKDTGPGMPSAVLDRVFDMHFTTKNTGTGIGLYVAQSVVQQHGGSIKVTSELGDGTEFLIALPIG